MFDEFFIEITKNGLLNYDIYTLGSRAAEWYARGQLSLEGFQTIQAMLVPGTGDGGEQD